METPDDRGRADASESSAASETGDQPGAPAPNRPAGWKFAASWIAFAITLLLTIWLGIEIVLGTRGFG